VLGAANIVTSAVVDRTQQYMRTSFQALLVPCALLLLTLGALATWSATVPRLITSSSFLAFAGLLVGCAWVTSRGYINARPARSLAQSLHDADVAEAARARSAR
jgi:hypothetical protein